MKDVEKEVGDRITLQCMLNTGVHLDLIGSNAVFRSHLLISSKVWGRLRPIVKPSSCKSILLRALIITDVSSGIRAVRELPAMKRRGRGNKPGKQAIAPPHPTRKQGCLSQYFPTSPNNSKACIPKRKAGRGIAVTIKSQDPSIKSSPPR